MQRTARSVVSALLVALHRHIRDARWACPRIAAVLGFGLLLGLYCMQAAHAQDYYKTYFPKQGGSTGAEQDFQTDLFTGSFQYQVPIALPPARGGFLPGVALQYSSSARNGWCGVGWSLEASSIQRDTRKGVPRSWNLVTNGLPLNSYDDSRGFVFCSRGSSSPLVDVGGGEYRTEIDRGLLTFRYSGGIWTMIEQSGVKHYFGEVSNSRMAHPDFSSTGGANIFRGLQELVWVARRV